MNEPILMYPFSKTELQSIIKETLSQVLTESKNRDKQKELLNSSDLIKWLGISLSTLNKWKAENKIPYKRLGKRIFFSKSEVLGALEQSNYNRLNELK